MKRRRKKTTTKSARAPLVPYVVAREPPPIAVETDARGKRGVYVRTPVSSETAEALEALFSAAGGLFRAAAGALAALERETVAPRRRR